jgi:hypothetical protein
MNYYFLAAKLSGVILYLVELGAETVVNCHGIYFFWNGEAY